jgi:hypothetical protein
LQLIQRILLPLIERPEQGRNYKKIARLAIERLSSSKGKNGIG